MPDWIKDFAPRHPRDGATARAITERRAIWSSDILEDPDFDLSPSTRAFIGASGLRAVLAVPLLVGERVLGAVLTARDTLGPFTGEQVELAQAIATHAALALENANLFSLEASRRTQIEAMTEVAREIAGELGRERLLRLVAERAGRLFDARGAIFILRGDQLVPEATTDPAVSLPVFAHGLRDHGPVRAAATRHARERLREPARGEARRPPRRHPAAHGPAAPRARPAPRRHHPDPPRRRCRALPGRRPRLAGAPRAAGGGGRPQRHPLRGSRAAAP